MVKTPRLRSGTNKKEMSLIDQVKADIRQITGNLNEWGQELILTPPGGEPVTIPGLHTKIHLGYDSEGNRINSKKAHASFSESYLTDIAYPVRNAAGQVDLRNHKITVKDSTGTWVTFLIEIWYPDETVGLIVVNLGTMV